MADKKESRRKLRPPASIGFPESRHPLRKDEPYERVVLTKFNKGGMVKGRDYAKKC